MVHRLEHEAQPPCAQQPYSHMSAVHRPAAVPLILNGPLPCRCAALPAAGGWAAQRGAVGGVWRQLDPGQVGQGQGQEGRGGGRASSRGSGRMGGAGAGAEAGAGAGAAQKGKGGGQPTAGTCQHACCPLKLAGTLQQVPRHMAHPTCSLLFLCPPVRLCPQQPWGCGVTNG
jgi:hypothetical protein